MGQRHFPGPILQIGTIGSDPRGTVTPIDVDIPTIPADRSPPGVDIQPPGADQISLGGGIWILEMDVWIPRRGYSPLDAD